MLEVIEESLVGLYHKHKGNHTSLVNISQFVKSLGLSTSILHSELELVNENTQPTHSLIRKDNGLSANRPKLNTSAEIMGLTLKVLAFLKISKNEFVNIETIPALQAKNWQQLGNLVTYLLDKKFVVIKGIDTKVYAQITQFGLQFLHACEATAC